MKKTFFLLIVLGAMLSACSKKVCPAYSGVEKTPATQVASV